MQVQEIIKFERGRATSEQCRTIHFFAVGAFWRAYEWSAWLLSLCGMEKLQFVLQSEGGENYFYVGFPRKDNSWAKYVPAEVERRDTISDDHVAVIIHQAKFTYAADPVKMMDGFSQFRQPLMERLLQESEASKKQKKQNAASESPDLAQFLADVKSQMMLMQQKIDTISTNDVTSKNKPISVMDILRNIMDFDIDCHTPNEALAFISSLQKNIRLVVGL